MKPPRGRCDLCRFLLRRDGKHFGNDALICDKWRAERAIKEELLRAAKFTLENSLLYRIAGWERLQAAVDTAESEAK